MAYESMYSSPNIFTAMIDEQGTIWEAGTGRKRQAVGVDSQREQELQNQIVEMQDVIDNYYNKLVELGAITIPKSPEQIAQEAAAEQALINQELLKAITSLQAELVEMKKAPPVKQEKPVYTKPTYKEESELSTNGDSGSGNGAGVVAVEQNSPSAGEKPAGNKKSFGAGKETAS